MRRHEAKKIAQSGITWSELRQLLVDARHAGQADRRRSVVNKGMTKGAAFNILWKAMEAKTGEPESTPRSTGEVLFATNIIYEFGGKLQPPRQRKPLPTPVHQEPVEIDADRPVPGGGE